MAMIYIKTEDTKIVFPRHNFTDSSAKITIYLNSPADHNYKFLEDLVNVSEREMYYEFNVLGIVLPVGEYEYIFINENGKEIENGLFTFGEYVKPTVISANVNNSIQQFQKR